MTTGPRALEDRWLMSQFYDGEKAYAFPMPMVKMIDRLWALFCKVMRLRRTWIMHNCAYDIQVLKAHGAPVPAEELLRDTMVLGLGLTERGEQVGLKALSRMYCNATYYEQELVGYSWQRGPQNKQQWIALAKYGCLDVYYTYQLAKILPPLVRAEGTMDLCKNLLMPAQLCFAGDPEYRGTLIDMDHVETLRREWMPLINEARRALQA